MSNHEVDLDTLTVAINPGSGREIFDPVAKSAWPDASSHVYVSTYRSGPESVFQVGYDNGSGKTWLRFLPTQDERWTDWVEVAAPAPPVRSKAKAKDEDEEEESPSRSPRKK